MGKKKAQPAPDPVIEDRLKEALEDVAAGRVSESLVDAPAGETKDQEIEKDPEPERVFDAEVAVLEAPENMGEVIGIEGDEIHRSPDGYFRLDRVAHRALIQQLVRSHGFKDLS